MKHKLKVNTDIKITAGFIFSFSAFGKIHFISVDNVIPKITVSKYLADVKLLVDIIPVSVASKTKGLFPDASKKDNEKGERLDKIFSLPMKNATVDKILISLYFVKNKFALNFKFLNIDVFFFSSSILNCSYAFFFILYTKEMEKNVKTKEQYQRIIRQIIKKHKFKQKIINFIKFIDKLIKSMYNKKAYCVHTIYAFAYT